ncbi:MAG: right-handed parallel beta-helix repeat-containing protein, partial [Candidatus Hermodarchaeota archaeon]
TGTVNNPYIIADWNISDSATHGISIRGTTMYFRIENCWIENSNVNGINVEHIAPGTSTITSNTCNNNVYDGIRIWGSHSSTVVNNTCTNNYKNGVSLRSSDSSTIANNFCNENLWDGIYSAISFSSTITNNTCTNNGDGINVLHFYSSTIINNTCTNNGDGITLSYSDSSTVVNNICNSNENNGINIFLSDINYIHWNSLVENGNYGIAIYYQSDDNFIHHNNFLANGQSESQAYDDGTNNQWFSQTELEGNYWSDYNGIGSYPIAGLAEAKDSYPASSSYKYIGETESQTDPRSFYSHLTRISLFILVVGALGSLLFINRWKKIRMKTNRKRTT